MKSELTNNFNKNVRYLSKVKDIKFSTLEKEAGVAHGYLSRFGNPKYNYVEMGVVKVYKIAKLLGVSVNEILEKDLEKENKIKDLESQITELLGNVDKLIRMKEALE